MPNYNPYQYYPQQQTAYQQQMNVAQPQQPQQIQNGGFITVPNEDVVYTYPIALGNCITFKVEGQPIVIEKIKGFSQFEAPIIKRYRLVEEEKQEVVKEATPDNIALDTIKGEIKAIWNEIATLKEPKKPVSRKKEVATDDTE